MHRRYRQKALNGRKGKKRLSGLEAGRCSEEELNERQKKPIKYFNYDHRCSSAGGPGTEWTLGGIGSGRHYFKVLGTIDEVVCLASRGLNRRFTKRAVTWTR